ncbi:hypothetical protein BDW22DRAFT_1343740 [Trametopsis cervina]|nr:hypothetical protein BDW22DRAFT_1343740 [Trametopsis cervina]
MGNINGNYAHSQLMLDFTDEVSLEKELQKLRRENKALKNGKTKATSKPSKTTKSQEASSQKLKTKHVHDDKPDDDDNGDNNNLDIDNDDDKQGGIATAESEDNQLNSSTSRTPFRSLGLVSVSRPLTARLGDPKPKQHRIEHLEVPSSGSEHDETPHAPRHIAPQLAQPSSPSTARVSTASSPPPSLRSSSPQLGPHSEHEHLHNSRSSSPSGSIASATRHHLGLTVIPPSIARSASSVPRSVSQPSLVPHSPSTSRSSSVSRLSSNNPSSRSKDQEPSSQDDVLVIEYKNGIVSVAFPSHETAHVWTRQALAESCQEAGKTLPAGEASERMCRLIEARPSTIRGHIKNKIIPKIVEVYGMQVDTTKTANEEANQRRYEYLVSKVGGDGDPNRYCYKDFDAEEPSYLGEHDILLRALQEWCFKSATDTGVEFSSDFNPIGLPTIAMLLTMFKVRFGLDRWATGRVIQGIGKKEFTEKEYKSIYEAHLTHLKDWEEANPPVMRNIRKKMYRKLLIQSFRKY